MPTKSLHTQIIIFIKKKSGRAPGRYEYRQSHRPIQSALFFWKIASCDQLPMNIPERESRLVVNLPPGGVCRADGWRTPFGRLTRSNIPLTPARTASRGRGRQQAHGSATATDTNGAPRPSFSNTPSSGAGFYGEIIYTDDVIFSTLLQRKYRRPLLD